MTRGELLGLWEPLLNSLQAVFEAIPDTPPNLGEPLWQGTFETPEGPKDEAAMPLGQLMAHLVVSSYEVPMVLGGKATFDDVRAAGEQLAGASVPELRAALAERVPKALALIGEGDDAELAEVRQLPFGPLTVGDAYMRGALHLVHHKGQLSVLARLAGARPGRFI